MDHLIYTGWLRELSLPELFSPENRQLRGDFINVYQHLKGGVRVWSQALLCGAEQEDKRRWAETGRRENPSGREDGCAGSVHTGISVQRGCGVSLSRDIPELAAHNLVHRALGWPCLSKEDGAAPGDPVRSLPALPIL